jgi:type II secretory pathway component PulM
MRLLLATLAAIALAGCGGGADAPDPTPTPGLSGKPIPLERYVARADRICRRGLKRVRAQLRPLQAQLGSDGALTPDDAMILNDAGAQLARPVTEEIAALPPPDRHRADAEAYTRALRDSLTTLRQAVDDYRAGDRAAAQDALSRNRALVGDIASAAAAVGFKQCGKEFSHSNAGPGRA